MIDSNNPVAVYPNGFKPGCLLRKTRPGERFPMAADRIKIVPSGEWDAAAAEIGDSLRKKVKAVLNQGQVGSCATESTTGADMLNRSCQGLEHILLNPLFVYHTTSGGSDSGSSIDDNLEFVRENGIAPESVWPRSKGWRAKPSAEAVEAAKAFKIEEAWDISNLNEFVSALLQGFAVVFGSQGHAVLAVEHMGSYPLILNSWGDWEDGGFGRWCSYNAVNWNYGAWALRVAS
jgi:hypothetical protein